ncbi:MAG: phosphomannomutase/phosphoglucomutase [Clostridiales bacterium]|nr:phosphomannomutase/phosphoglucomutase [Clostridiales bacterium]
MNNYGILKSGTDIRGRAIESEGKSAPLTEQAVRDLASAFALWVVRRMDKPRCKIAIARDSRLTSEGFSRAIVAELKYAGLEIFDCGLFSTPAAYMVTQFPSMFADGSIMITASHHPSDINGLKFFVPEGGVNSAQLDEIIELANNGEKPERSSTSTVIRRDFLRLYCDSLTETIRKGTGLFLPLKGMKIAVDAGHGVGGFFAKRVIEPLGGNISPSQYLEPNGNFPAHAPNPENAEAMQSLKNRVIATGADLGIIFDADADRCAVVTADGTEINRSRLIALAAAMILPDHQGATIVTDSVTNEGLRMFIESRGGVQKRFKRGYRNVIDEAKRLCDEGVDAPLAIESSGHAAFADHYFLDDGAYFIAKILIVMSGLRKKGMSLNDLIDDLQMPLEERDIRLSFTCENWREVADKIIARLTAMSERMLRLSDDNYEGVRAYVSHADGYFIVRTSVHDPVLPIYIESDKAGGSLSIARLLYSFLNGFVGLDTTPLYELIADAEQQAYEQSETDEVYETTDEEYAAETDEAYETANDDYAAETDEVYETAEGDYAADTDETYETAEGDYATETDEVYETAEGDYAVESDEAYDVEDEFETVDTEE